MKDLRDLTDLTIHVNSAFDDGHQTIEKLPESAFLHRSPPWFFIVGMAVRSEEGEHRRIEVEARSFPAKNTTL